MIHYLCAIRDQKTEAFGLPFGVPKIGVALRGFADAINNGLNQTTMHMHPEDHDLYEMGLYDDNDGSLVQLPHPRLLAKGSEVTLPIN